MKDVGKGASLRDRAVVNGAASVSAVPASVPSANGPDLWRAILKRMPEGSVIAGGAVRDYLLGFEPKDIDVFIDMGAALASLGEGDVDAFSSIDPRFGLDRIDNEHLRFEEYAAISDIVCVSSGSIQGHRVDAVVMENYSGGAALVAGFDFAVNQSWFDGEIHDTPEAERDRNERTVTLLSDEREERSAVRFARLNERWGGEWRYCHAAQAIEARRAATGTGAVHESAVGAADAPNLGHTPNAGGR